MPSNAAAVGYNQPPMASLTHPGDNMPPPPPPQRRAPTQTSQTPRHASQGGTGAASDRVVAPGRSGTIQGVPQSATASVRHAHTIPTQLSHRTVSSATAVARSVRETHARWISSATAPTRATAAPDRVAAATYSAQNHPTAPNPFYNGQGFTSHGTGTGHRQHSSAFVQPDARPGVTVAHPREIPESGHSAHGAAGPYPAYQLSGHPSSSSFTPGTGRSAQLASFAQGSAAADAPPPAPRPAHRQLLSGPGAHNYQMQRVDMTLALSGTGSDDGRRGTLLSHSLSDPIQDGASPDTADAATYAAAGFDGHYHHNAVAGPSNVRTHARSATTHPPDPRHQEYNASAGSPAAAHAGDQHASADPATGTSQRVYKSSQ